MYVISPVIKQYDWGKIGTSSIVAQLHSNNDMSINANDPYAEIWYGTHVNGPATIKLTDQLLSHAIFRSEEVAKKMVGDHVVKFMKNSNQLPYLLKVLSVGKALSIQAHPDRNTARKLHDMFPQCYKDPNHKPEMAVALTEFELLAQFRPFREILKFLKDVPQFRNVTLGTDNVESITCCDLPKLYSELMRCNNDRIVENLKSLINHMDDNALIDPIINKLIKRLYIDHPDDVGIFSVFFLNYIKLNPGSAVFIPANEPHTYIYGDCIECMACSDNVIRAGLTQKFKDVDTLINMLSYKTGPPERFEGNVTDIAGCNIIRYKPPSDVCEFMITKCTFKQSTTLRGCEGPTVCFVYSGCGKMINSNKCVDIMMGSAFFIGSLEDVNIDVPHGDIVLWMAQCNDSMFIDNDVY
jgi:mannose-6-phosphate isomerase